MSNWTIYNNTLTWEQLSDKKKGKLLLAEHNKEIIKMVAASLGGQDVFLHSVKIDSSKPIIYRAAPPPVKAGSTMEELFISDWQDTVSNLLRDFSKHMIAKGWKK
jgi:hypothetical protein